MCGCIDNNVLHKLIETLSTKWDGDWSLQYWERTPPQWFVTRYSIGKGEILVGQGDTVEKAVDAAVEQIELWDNQAPEEQQSACPKGILG